MDELLMKKIDGSLKCTRCDNFWFEYDIERFDKTNYICPKHFGYEEQLKNKPKANEIMQGNMCYCCGHADYDPDIGYCIWCGY